MAKNWAMPSATRNGNAICINRYDLLQPLNYAKRDAQLIQEFLRDEAGFERIYFFSDDSPDIDGKSTRPNRTNLLRILRQLFENPFLGTGDNFWFFFSGHGIRHKVNYDGNYTYASAPKGQYHQQTTPVGIFPPNSFGLYDMHGNTWEWCLATDGNKYEGEPKDSSTWLLRGGSWNSHPWGCRSANRFKIAERSNNIGFRLVCVVA